MTVVDGVFVCTCCSFKRAGTPYQHIAVVLKMIDVNWNGFTHHDVAVRWLTSYIMFGYRYNNASTREISRLLHIQRLNDIKGPSAQGLSFTHIPIVNSISSTSPLMIPNSMNGVESAIFRCKNYPQEYLRSLNNGWDGMQTTTCFGEIATQESIFEQDVMDNEHLSTNNGNKENCVDVFAESLNDCSFKANATPGDTRTRFKGLLSEVFQVLDYKKDPKSDAEFELLVSNFLSKTRAEIHEKNSSNSNNRSATVSILTERETCNRARVFNTKNYFS